MRGIVTLRCFTRLAWPTRGHGNTMGVVGDGLQPRCGRTARVQLARSARAAWVCEDCERRAVFDATRNEAMDAAHPHDADVCRVVLHAIVTHARIARAPAGSGA